MDNLFGPSATSDSTGEVVPSYLQAADNHNIGNSMGGSWFDPDTWGTKFENTGKFIATAALSGADSFYNTAMTVGKWTGISDEGGHDTLDFISSIDDDLGKYYESNRTAVDLVGFVATSFIPGLGGIKILNAGQTALKAATKSGFIGANLAKATGLLVPETEMFVKSAAKDIVQSQVATSILNANTLKALSAGVWQNTLEGAAFETMVQATMAKSPVLSDQDGYDIAKNIAFGGVVSGAIGGVFSAAKSVGQIKRFVADENSSLRAASSRVQPLDATPAGQKIILAAEDRDAVFTAPARNDTSALNQDEANALGAKLVADKVTRANNFIRTEINGLVQGSDGTVGNMVADALHMAPAKDMLNATLHLQEIGTLGTTTGVERAVKKAINSLDIEALAPLETRYVKLVGEGAGTITDSAPVISKIADTVKSSVGNSLENAVLSAVREYKFSANTEWSASALKGSGAHTEAEARYIWANSIIPEIKPETIINEHDFPLLERAYKDMQAGESVSFKMKMADGSITNNPTQRDLLDHLTKTKPEVANDLLQKMVLEGSMPVESGTEAIAKIVNMRESALTGTMNTSNPTSDLFAKQAIDDAHHASLVSKGLRSSADEVADTAFLPSYAKLAYKTEDLKDVSGNILDGMVWIKQQQQMYQEAADRVFAFRAGDIAENAPVISDSQLLNANLSDGGARLVSFANGGYGSLGSYMQQIGANVTRPLKEMFRKQTSETFTAPLVAMGQKQEAAIEWSVISNKVASTTEQYVLDVEAHSGNTQALVAKKIRDYHEAIANGEENVAAPVLQKGAPEFIPIKNEETYNAIEAHIQRSGDRVQVNKEVNAIAGKTDEKFTDIFRPVPPNPNDYPFIAFVKDNKVTGAGHTTMIHAASQKELDALIAKVPTENGYKVFTKTEAEDFYKARGEYDFAKTLHENYVNSDLKSQGINSQFFTQTDPQKIVDDILKFHLRQDDVTAVNLVNMKYQPVFDWLADQGKQYTNLESSRYGTALDRAEKYGKNPFTDYTKTALDVSKASEYGLLYDANRAIDNAVSTVYGKISDVFSKAKSPEELDSINTILQSHGVNTAYYDAATELLANHEAPKGVLSKFIRSSNGMLSKFVLALDPLNALNNAIGANILRSTELKQLTDAINAGDSKLAGQLAGVAKIIVPGTDSASVAPSKLLATALKNFVQDDGTLLAQYKSEGLVKDSLQQFKSMMDDFTLKGTETAAELDSRLKSAFTKAVTLGEKVTGNKFAEEFNRFMSANVMHQITDLGESAGLMTSAESKAYRNTFVNRVEGNTTASQRPVMFQGPIGQAVGLFQSYQFNLMQQMFRYVGEGSGKDAAMLLGLQGTFYGINGMPAFNAINNHIVGNLSGNKNHTDLYDATYGVAGKTAGDFLMYGAPSSIIQTNLYSRGDINPRQVTIIPTSFKDIPVVSAYTKLFGSMFDTVSKVKDGANIWESVLQGVEHNGISRPLAGLAQDLQSTTGNGKVFSTSNKGTILSSNDFLSFASLSRLAGGRPLDEAIINDGTYRIQAYEAAQKQARDTLTEAVKASTIQGQTQDTEQLSKFAELYAATGGKQAQFNKYFLSTYKAANTSQSEKILKQLNNPFTQKMQILMGGRNDNAPDPIAQNVEGQSSN